MSRGYARAVKKRLALNPAQKCESRKISKRNGLTTQSTPAICAVPVVADLLRKALIAGTADRRTADASVRGSKFLVPARSRIAVGICL